MTSQRTHICNVNRGYVWRRVRRTLVISYLLRLFFYLRPYFQSQWNSTCDNSSHSLHHFLGLPTSLLLPTSKFSTTLAALYSPGLLTCPYQRSLPCLSFTSNSLTPQLTATSALATRSCHLKPAIYRSILRSYTLRTPNNLSFRPMFHTAKQPLCRPHAALLYFLGVHCNSSASSPLFSTFPLLLPLSSLLLFPLRACFTINHIFHIAELLNFLQLPTIQNQICSLIFFILLSSLSTSRASQISKSRIFLTTPVITLHALYKVHSNLPSTATVLQSPRHYPYICCFQSSWSLFFPYSFSFPFVPSLLSICWAFPKPYLLFLLFQIPASHKGVYCVAQTTCS